MLFPLHVHRVNHTPNLSLSAVDVRPLALSGVRSIVDVTISFTNLATDVVEKRFLRIKKWL